MMVITLLSSELKVLSFCDLTVKLLNVYSLPCDIIYCDTCWLRDVISIMTPAKWVILHIQYDTWRLSDIIFITTPVKWVILYILWHLPIEWYHIYYDTCWVSNFIDIVTPADWVILYLLWHLSSEWYHLYIVTHADSVHSEPWSFFYSHNCCKRIFTCGTI